MPWSRVRGRGTYAPLSERYYWDDAIAEAGEAAELMFLRGLAFSAGARADGHITERQAATVVGMGLDGVEDRVKALVRVGLWIEDAERGGYVVRSWLKWNRSRDEIEDFAARDAARKRSSRGIPPESGRTADGIRPQSRAEQSRSEQSNVHPDTPCPGVDVDADASAGAPAGPPDAAPEGRRAVPAPPAVAELRAQLAARRVRRAGGAR